MLSGTYNDTHLSIYYCEAIQSASCRQVVLKIQRVWCSVFRLKILTNEVGANKNQFESHNSNG